MSFSSYTNKMLRYFLFFFIIYFLGGAAMGNKKRQNVFCSQQTSVWLFAFSHSSDANGYMNM